MAPFSLSIIEACFANMDGRVTYRYGGKAPSLTADTSEIHSLDCSGFTDYVLARASNQQTILPAGSYYEHQWCIEQGLHQLAQYSDVQYAALDDSRLFIAFIAASHIEPIGHVWLVRGGQTRECYGGHGVGSRPWDYPILKHRATSAFELPVIP